MSAAARRELVLATSAGPMHRKVPSVMVCGEALTLKPSFPKLAMPASFSTSRFASESPFTPLSEFGRAFKCRGRHAALAKELRQSPAVSTCCHAFLHS